MVPCESYQLLASCHKSNALSPRQVQCTKVMEYCAREAAQIFGGLSYSRGGQGEKVERLNREVRAMAIPGGSEESRRDVLGGWEVWGMSEG